MYLLFGVPVLLSNVLPKHFRANNSITTKNPVYGNRNGDTSAVMKISTRFVGNDGNTASSIIVFLVAKQLRMYTTVSMICLVPFIEILPNPIFRETAYWSLILWPSVCSSCAGSTIRLKNLNACAHPKIAIWSYWKRMKTDIINW